MQGASLVVVPVIHLFRATCEEMIRCRVSRPTSSDPALLTHACLPPNGLQRGRTVAAAENPLYGAQVALLGSFAEVADGSLRVTRRDAQKDHSALFVSRLADLSSGGAPSFNAAGQRPHQVPPGALALNELHCLAVALRYVSRVRVRACLCF